MRKESTVFIICLLALFADALGFRQILILWQNGKFYNESIGGAILTSLVVTAICLLWLICVLLRKIIDRSLN